MDSITSKLGVEAQNYHSVNVLNHFKHEILLAQGLSHYFNGRRTPDSGANCDRVILQDLLTFALCG